MQAVVEGLLTNYELKGSGKLVVWLHGWGDAAASSGAFRTELAKKYKVIAPDLPGFGVTEAPHEAWDLDDYAHWVMELLAKLGLGEPYAVIGHSNGGAIAIRANALGLIKPEKLVLLASAGVRTQQNARKTGLKLLAKTGKVATLALPKSQRAKLRTKLYQKAGSDILVAPQLEATFKKVVGQDVQADAAKLTQPTLLIYGDQDTATPPSMGETYQHIIKNSALHIVPNAGHFVYLDQAAQVVQLVEDFLT